MRPAASVLAVTLLLLAPTFIAGPASAEWTQLHRFAGSLGRQLLAWDVDDNGTLYFATEHERQFLLFERGEGFALNSTYLRPSANLHRVAVVQLNGTWGVLYQERVASHDHANGKRAPLVFTWPHNVTEAASMVIRSGSGGGIPHWSVDSAPDPYPLGPTHQARQDPEDGRVHFLRVVEGGYIRVSSLNASALTFNASGDEDLVLDPLPREDQARAWEDNVSDWRLGQGEIRLLPNGSVFAVNWDESGAYATRWNVTGAEVKERLSPYWDYQSARLSWTSNGTYAVMMGQRRDVCDLFVRWPGGEWNQSVVEKCPLVDHEYGLQEFEVRDDGSLRGLTSRGFWTTDSTRVESLPCIPSAGFWDRRPDGREFLRGPGPSVWMKSGAPNVTVTTDPAGEVPTGLGVQFRLEGNLSHLTDPTVVWHFEGRRAVGESATHAFLEPGEQTVTVVVESGLEGCRMPAVRETLTLTATGVDRSTPEPAAGNETEENATDANTTGTFMGMPAPGAPVALLATLAVAALVGARRGRGA